jgi:hypothetical protein
MTAEIRHSTHTIGSRQAVSYASSHACALRGSRERAGEPSARGGSVPFAARAASAGRGDVLDAHHPRAVWDHGFAQPGTPGVSRGGSTSIRFHSFLGRTFPNVNASHPQGAALDEA